MEVLLSCMNQTDFSLVDKCRIRTDAVIINQHTNNSYAEITVDGKKITMFSSTQRGLSRSRNYALSQATGDICLLCDDDVTYVDNYETIVIEAFQTLPQADIIVFNTNLVNAFEPRNPIVKIRKAPRYKLYGSVRMAFRLDSIRRANVWFNTNFGAGSKYSAGEESLWLLELRKKGLQVYEYPATICAVDYSESTWFTGRNEKYYYDKGAFLAAGYPRLKGILKYYLAFRLGNATDLGKRDILRWIKNGMKGYEASLSFEEYTASYFQQTPPLRVDRSEV